MSHCSTFLSVRETDNISCLSTLKHLCLSHERDRSHIEKVLRGIQGEKSSKDMTSSRIWSHQLAQASPEKGDGTRCPEDKRSLLACHTSRKYSLETSCNSVFKFGINDIKSSADQNNVTRT